MGLYGEYQANRVKVGPVQEALERTYGNEKDEQQDRITQALQVGYPGLAPADALKFIGAERMLPRVSGEADNVYAERLRTAWDSLHGWSFAGSHGSLLRALERAGFPQGDPDGAHIIQKTKRYSYLNAGTVVFGTHDGMTFDTTAPKIWNQFIVLFGADVADLDPGSPLADTLNMTVRQWKPAKARFMGTFVLETGVAWGWPPDLDWGDAGLDWGESVVRFIPPV